MPTTAPITSVTVQAHPWPGLVPTARPTKPSPLAVDALHDLALDQVVQRLNDQLHDADLAAVMTLPLASSADLIARQATFRALEVPATRDVVQQLLDAVGDYRSRQNTAAKSYNQTEADLWRLYAAREYLDTLTEIATALPQALDAGDVDAPALRDFATACEHRASDASFAALRARACELSSAVRGAQAAVWLHGGTITVARYDDEPDDARTVQEAFARFRGPQQPSRPVSASRRGGTSGRRMDEAQAQVLAMTAQLHPEIFQDVHAFAQSESQVLDALVERFAREARLFLAYLDLLAPLRAAGLPTCYPVIRDQPGLTAEAVYDLALAGKLVSDGTPVITNDVHLEHDERLLVITGPNQGGKTTLARTLGQLHHLAAVGVPVAGRRVELALTDQVLTHFERPERLDNLAGRLGEGLQRMKAVLEHATAGSVLVLNEVFTSTALDDARFLTREILTRAHELGSLVVCVTFIDDIATFDDQTISMVADIDPDDPARRTFHLTRRPADGRAYARALAERHGLDADRIRHRLEEMS